MDLLYVLQLARAILKELWRHKYTAILVGAVTGFGVMGYGIMWQEQYEVSTKLYADRQNIISPLLAGQAAVTKVENQTQVVRDLMLSPRILEKVVEEEGFLAGGESAAQRAAIANSLGDRVNVRMLGDNYISVDFADSSPDRAYAVITRLVDFFITESTASKKSQSKQAFLFIDRQANSYKEQLREAEEKLKNFQATNLDGTEAQVAGRIERLRTDISNLELEVEQVDASISSLKGEVDQEDRYLTQKARADLYRERIATAVGQLDDLRLSLTDNHPDVINLREHIEGLRRAAASGDDLPGVGGSAQPAENPVYDQLRGQLAAAQVEKSTMQKRLQSLEQRLVEETERAKRIAARNAELSELTRDYDVTKGLYEDLLNRKEQARLSMTLDIEGQGVTYKIQEPAQFPLSPAGLSFINFVMLGVAAGLMVPIAIAVAYVLLDPRLRFPAALVDSVDVPVLGVVPHYVSLPEKRSRIRHVQLLMILTLVVALLYFGIAAFVMLLD